MSVVLLARFWLRPERLGPIAYVLKGNHHDVATLVDQDRELRESNAASFAGATTQMIDNFDVALTKFEADVRAGKANIRVAQRASTGARGGGGSFGPLALGVLLILLAARRSRRGELRLV